ncbi:MAG: imidazoleglycerol-phosphate dehydratase HisB [Syntrophales bacterium]
MRKAVIARKTAETDISLEIDLDGKGKNQIDSTIPFLNHMLQLFSRHGMIDLVLRGRGDTAVDDHHLVEDIGICLGKAVREALGDREGICRYGSAVVPMDESLSSVAIDISGRPWLVWNAEFSEQLVGNFNPALLQDFFKSFSDHSGINVHITVNYGRNGHHKAEAIFKAFARALHGAAQIDKRIEGVLSTKGHLEG